MNEDDSSQLAPDTSEVSFYPQIKPMEDIATAKVKVEARPPLLAMTANNGITGIGNSSLYTASNNGFIGKINQGNFFILVCIPKNQE